MAHLSRSLKMRTSPSHPLAGHLLILFLYVVITLVITYPLPFRLATHVVQADEGWALDAYQYVWTMWWTDKALLDLHSSPADLKWIQFPAGVYHPFLLATDYVGFAGLPLTHLASPAVAYNVLTLLAFILSGFTMYLFCMDLTGNYWGSFVGGLVFAFLPNRMAHAIGGHVDLISTYWFPLYGLSLMRLLRRPGVLPACLCGITLSLSAWVQTLYVPYLLVPLTVVALVHVCLVERRPLRPALPTLALALGVAGLTTAPFLLPFLLGILRGKLGYLQEEGATVFSTDLLGFLAPSPTNPVLRHLGLIPSFAQRVVPENFVLTEVLSYLGLLPLALAAWATWHWHRRVAVWTILSALAALLSLGPLLQANGHLVALEIDGLQSYVPLPYALLMHVPGLALGRTPGRLGMTVGFGLAVLVAYGWADLVERLALRFRLAPGTRHGRRPGSSRETSAEAGAPVIPSEYGCTHPRNLLPTRLVATILVSALVLVEYLVYWPLPTLSLQVPDYLQQMAGSADRAAVLSIPMTRRRVNQMALYYQSIHGKPLIGGRVFRDLPAPSGLAPFLHDLNQTPPKEDIIPRAAPETVADIDRTCNVGHVFLFKNYVEDTDQAQAFLTTAFGSPASADQDLAIFHVPPGATTVNQSVYALDHHWHAVENWAGTPARWMPERAELYVYSPGPQEGALRFAALPLLPPQRLQVEVNGVPLPPLAIGDWMTYTTPLFTLQAGVNRISLNTLAGCTAFVGDPRCMGPARAAGADCNPYLRVERCLSILFQNVRFLPATVGPAEHPLDVVLGERIHLLGWDLQGFPVPGQPLSLTLYWQALDAIEQDYVIFVHLLGSDGHLLAQNDAPPLNGIYPTSQWIAGDVFTHQATLTIPADAPPGKYNLLVGMYTYPDLARLPVASDRPHAQDSLIWLQDVEIRP